MPLERYAADFSILSKETLAKWVGCPSAIAGDAMNRARCMIGAIKPLRPGMALVGQARTVQVPAGDNAAIHVALAIARRGEVLVIDACAHPDTSVWGGILTDAAKRCGLAGIVLDGATRDAGEIAQLGFPVFCRAVSPRGGQKGGFGMVDGDVAVGGVTVRSGDLILADDDGVAVVPLHLVESVWAEVEKVKSKEAEILAGIAQGRTSADVLGIKVPEINR
ncbi:RraA family protein [Microvirga antarctica]|uniref:RraA family protein n=1 Tax=Microvirga antarctica TaxID=2819233 RepID=UPI001B301983|nr:RraA family protein [Microvirga antarctica]